MFALVFCVRNLVGCILVPDAISYRLSWIGSAQLLRTGYNLYITQKLY